MTTKEAVLLAREAFGPAGMVARSKTADPRIRFNVGVRTDKGFGVLGRGKSWEAAYEDAAERLAERAP